MGSDALLAALNQDERAIADRYIAACTTAEEHGLSVNPGKWFGYGQYDHPSSCCINGALLVHSYGIRDGVRQNLKNEAVARILRQPLSFVEGSIYAYDGGVKEWRYSDPAWQRGYRIGLALRQWTEGLP